MVLVRRLEGVHEELVHELVQEVSRLGVLVRVVVVRGPVLHEPAEPRDRVVAVAPEDVAAVEHAVVVAEEHVPRLHGDLLDVGLGDGVDVVEVRVGDGREVAVVDLRHADLRHGAGPAVPQVARVVVDVAEPEQLARLRVAVEGRRDLLDRLHAHGVAVRAVLHLEVHVELGRHQLVDEHARALHEGLLQAHLRVLLGARQPHVEVEALEEVQVEVGDGDADLAVVEALGHVGVQVPGDLGRVRDEELAAPLRGWLEAHEGAVLGRLLVRRLLVQADVVLAQRLLVDLLVDGVALGREGAEAGRVDGVEARVQAHGLVPFPEARLVLHEVEAAEPEAPVRLQVRQDLLAVLAEVLHAQARARGHALGRALRQRLQVLPRGGDVDVVRVPDGRRAVGDVSGKVARLGGRISLFERRRSSRDAVGARRRRVEQRAGCGNRGGDG
mmetsp:Transcript_14178/g.42250  ORF Transcript_14178/g.42250 Transcript_14178/m.42250 type:complete len:442 (-) Transcript_14178:147-1472(-)